MTEWKEYKLDEIAEILNSKRKPLNAIERSKRQGKYPYYGASGIVDYIDDYILNGEYVLISEDGENLKSRQTPIAFKVQGKFWVNNHAHIVKGLRPHLNDLIVYFFSNFDLNQYLTGAVQPKLSKENLLSIPIHLPDSITEQQAIASVLSSLDNKIDLLHRQNQTLEAMAETLFRQWFIEEAEESWEEITVSHIAEHVKENINPSKHPTKVFRHYSLPAFDNGQNPIPELGKEIMSNKYKVDSYSILISKLNPRTPRIWPIYKTIDINSCVCSTEFQVVKPLNIKYFGFLYWYLKSFKVTQELGNSSSGTSGSHQRINPSDIFNLKFPLPPIKKIDDFDLITSHYLEKINMNRTQIQTLTQLRDTLLPKLMSGEVRVEM